MSVDDHLASPRDPEGPVNDLLTYAQLLNSPQLARLYSYVLQHGPVEIEAIKEDLEMPHSTTYKYVGQLEEMGVLTRHDEESPATVTATPIHLEIETDQGTVTASPTLVEAIGRQLEDEDLRVFVDRQGIAKLAGALHYARRIRNGELTQRTAANRLGVHPVEGMTVFTALQDVIEDVAEDDPHLERSE
ncbi:DUF7437 domain-containing protein [Halopiger goleimassiliensis]|uniref:DUF7437 domain-containing protein n=1 Tax=Halopiger goleimassiliensis TaxID=1293048 RepID=UPI000677B6CE|nr:helix-turn-helix domain-containing protein [Halopiger goleimassiliensis]